MQGQPCDLKIFAETGEAVPVPLTPKPKFKAGQGRADAEVIHRAVEMLDSDVYTTYQVREVLVAHLNHYYSEDKPA